MENFIEQLIAEYYRSKGYFVTTNHWFSFEHLRSRTRKTGEVQEYDARGWSDIDVLALSEKELLIIQVKAVINTEQVPDQIVNFFDRVSSYLNEGTGPNGESDITWWTKGRKVTRMVIYEYNAAKSYIHNIEANGILVKLFTDFFEDILTYIKDKKGTKEQSSLLRLVHFMQKEGFIVQSDNSKSESSLPATTSTDSIKSTKSILWFLMNFVFSSTDLPLREASPKHCGRILQR